MRISDWSSDVCSSDLTVARVDQIDLASDDQRICRLGTLLPRDRAAGGAEQKKRRRTSRWNFGKAPAVPPRPPKRRSGGKWFHPTNANFRSGGPAHRPTPLADRSSRVYTWRTRLRTERGSFRNEWVSKC